MFNLVTPMPFLLDYSFYAPLLLRLALGVFILAIGFTAKHRADLSPELRTELTPFEMAYRAVFIAAGISLVIGLFTQVSAAIVVLLMLAAISDPRARLSRELNRAELALLLVIALSLMVTGAGPFAFDLPL